MLFCWNEKLVCLVTSEYRATALDLAFVFITKKKSVNNPAPMENKGTIIGSTIAGYVYGRGYQVILQTGNSHSDLNSVVIHGT